jgi:hypothetical protein
LKPAALSRQSLREGEPASLRIKAAQYAIEWLHSDCKAVDSAQPLGDGVVHLGGSGGAGRGDAVGGFFEYA